MGSFLFVCCERFAHLDFQNQVPIEQGRFPFRRQYRETIGRAVVLPLQWTGNGNSPIHFLVALLLWVEFVHGVRDKVKLFKRNDFESFRKRAGVREVIKIIAHFFPNHIVDTKNKPIVKGKKESPSSLFLTIAIRRKQLTENLLEDVIDSEYKSKEDPNRNAASNAISIALTGARKPFSAATIQDGFFSNASGSCQKVKDDGTSSFWRYLES